jgi:hypothetical protein
MASIRSAPRRQISSKGEGELGASVVSSDYPEHRRTFSRRRHRAGSSDQLDRRVRRAHHQLPHPQPPFISPDLAFTGGAVLTGSTSVESIELWKDTGTNTTSPLIANFDDYTGLPLTPSGGDVTIVWAATGILRF